ncbi:hypothetical protein Slin15195_G100660 [Septoria linicola]|uniref:Uncharacterized protein n=1 Tax=Septoria linicola TaxID=215465 RepID=A0A9Q9ENL4_9PEZI|nr:hypothetical protein Slin15195_G100660 [Septoria linicola]
MPTLTWRDYERRDVFILQNEYDMPDEQVHDMIGRLHGEGWKKQGRKKYNIGDIRDEGKHRWAPGKRHSDWNTIDPTVLPHSAQEQKLRGESHERIKKAAAISTGKNWLTGKDNSLIILWPKTGYVRDPSTFNPRKSKKNNNSKRKVANSKRTTRQVDSVLSSPNLAPSAQGRTVADTKQEHASSSKKQRPLLKLPMVHAKSLRSREQGLLLRSLESKKPVGVGYDSEIYQYGVMIVRTWNGITEQKEHVLVCNEDVCATCQGEDTDAQGGKANGRNR